MLYFQILDICYIFCIFYDNRYQTKNKRKTSLGIVYVAINFTYPNHGEIMLSFAFKMRDKILKTSAHALS